MTGVQIPDRAFSEKSRSSDSTGVVVDVLLECDARGELPAFFAADAVDVFTTDGDLPYALWFLDGPDLEHAGITVHEGGAVVGVLHNERPAVVENYRDQYESIRGRASRLDADALDE